jgi:phosphoribosylformylglycinamidine synthase subunit PurL
MMLSESQERMLMILRPEMEAASHAIFKKWGLDFAIIGKTTDTLRFVVTHQGEVKADLPIKQMGDEAPEYDRPWVAPTKPAALADVTPPADLRAAILKLVGSPDMSSRRWVWEQYDTLIQSNSAQVPGGDAGVVRISGTKAIAVTSDCTPRYVEADPYEGGKQAVAESWRNLTAVGATPIAITDNLNFGNPERPEIMGQFVFALKGMGEACRALDYPIVSGNVSLYNETNGQGILPTPTVGGVGLMADWRKMATVRFKKKGDAILLVGVKGSHLGQSAYLRDVEGREEGPPPPVDLALEKKNGDFVRELIIEGRVTACHDISDGGLAAAVVDMALAGSLGAELTVGDFRELFGEDQARYMLTCTPLEVVKIITQAHVKGVDIVRVGTVSGLDEVNFGGTVVTLAELGAAFEGWFPAFMAG